MPKTATTPTTASARSTRRPSARPPRPRDSSFALDEPVPGHRLAARGRLDVAAAADARLALAHAVGQGDGDLVLDLSGLQKIDATGLGVLVGAHRAAGRAGRTLVLLDVPAQVERLLFVTRLYRVIHTVRTELTATG